MRDNIYLSGWRYQALILSIVLSALGYLGFSLWGGWAEVSRAAALVGLGGMGLVLLMSLLNYGLRFLRWQAYLGTLGHRIPWRPSMSIYLAGFALTTTPGKAGEALRGVFLKHWAVPYQQSFAAFFSERLSDLFAVVMLALLGLSLYPEARHIIIIAGALLLLSFLALSQVSLLTRLMQLIPARGGKPGQMLRHILQILLEAQRCHQPRLLLLASGLSLLAWGAEALAFHWLLGWMGADLPLSFTIFVYAISMLAGALSFMPGGLGGAEAVMVALLMWRGMSAADAVAATVLIRLATLWFAVALGAAALSSSQSKYRPSAPR